MEEKTFLEAKNGYSRSKYIGSEVFQILFALYA